MAPKKKGGAKAKKEKKPAGDESAELTPEQLVKRAALRIESLEQQLMWREEKLSQALEAQRKLKDKVNLYHSDFEKEKHEIFDIAADMTRQYKGMQEELLSRINLLENQINEQKDSLEHARLQLEEERRDRAQELAYKDAEIAEQKQRMEEMAIEFGDMLKETLDRMGAQIDLQASSWEQESGAGVSKRLEQFKMGVTTDF